MHMSLPRKIKLPPQDKRRLSESIFDEEEWHKLKGLSGLPDSARSEVEDILGFLRAKPSVKHPLATELQNSRKNMCKTTKSLNRALRDLNDLIRSGVGFVFHAMEPESHNGVYAVASKHEVTCLRDLMQRVKSDLEYSERRLKYAPPGAPLSHLSIAVGALNDIVLEGTGRPLDQKKTDRDGINLSEFALKVCQKAQPSLKIGAIVNLIKELQSARSRRRQRKQSRRRRREK
jgi:hypothetical protein